MEKIIPVVVINKLEDTEKIIMNLLKGGINIAEITLRTECASQAIKLAVNKFPDMEIGAGTVINAKQCKHAIECGAKFVVSPGLSEEVYKICKEKNIAYYPGCVTPSEIMKAISLGITIIKFFPADIYGGIKAIKALSAPFPQIKFIPTGGVNLDNLNLYLSYNKVYAVGGSFMMKDDIEKNCKKIMEIIKNI